MKSKKTCPLAARIKKLMQADDDVGKIAQATPVMLARAMELFLQQLCDKTAAVAQSRQAKTISTSHLKQCVSMEETLDFLKEAVAAAPDLPAEDAAPAKAAKRRRASAAEPDVDGALGAVKKPRGRARKASQEDEACEAPAGDEGADHAMDVDAHAQAGDTLRTSMAPKKPPRGPRRKAQAAAAHEDEDHDTDPETMADCTAVTAKPTRRGRASKTAALSVIQTLADGDAAACGNGDGDSDGRQQETARKRGRRRVSGAQHMQGLLAPSIPPVQQEQLPEVTEGVCVKEEPGNLQPGSSQSSLLGGRGNAASEPKSADQGKSDEAGVPAAGQAAVTGGAVQSDHTGSAITAPAEGTTHPAARPNTSAAPSSSDKDNQVEQQGAEVVDVAAAQVAAAAAAVLGMLQPTNASSSQPLHAPSDNHTSVVPKPAAVKPEQSAEAGSVSMGSIPAQHPPPPARPLKKEKPTAGASGPAVPSTSSLRSALPFSMRRPMAKKASTPTPPAEALTQVSLINSSEVSTTDAGLPAGGTTLAIPTVVPAPAHVTAVHATNTAQADAVPALLSGQPAPASIALHHLPAPAVPGIGAVVSAQPCAPPAVALPMLPPTAHLAHLAAASAQDYDDDYDNI